jgi:hypothetical protein
VNAALFMLTSAWVAGADAAPPPAIAAPPGAPAVVSTGSSCGGGCGTACDTGCDTGCGKHKRGGLFSRSGGKHNKGGCCDIAPTCAPAPIAAPSCGGCATACDTGCGKHKRGGLFSRSGGKHNKGGCCDIAQSCDSCGAGGIAPAPIYPGGTKPEVIPPPKDKKEMPKGGVTGITIEPIVTPVVAPRPPIEVGGPTNPF